MSTAKQDERITLAHVDPSGALLALTSADRALAVTKWPSRTGLDVLEAGVWREATDEDRHLLGTHPEALAFVRAFGSSEDLWIAEPAPTAEAIRSAREAKRRHRAAVREGEHGLAPETDTAPPGEPYCPLCLGTGWIVERDEAGKAIAGHSCECASRWKPADEAEGRIA